MRCAKLLDLGLASAEIDDDVGVLVAMQKLTALGLVRRAHEGMQSQVEGHPSQFALARTSEETPESWISHSVDGVAVDVLGDLLRECGFAPAGLRT